MMDEGNLVAVVVDHDILYGGKKKEEENMHILNVCAFSPPDYIKNT